MKNPPSPPSLEALGLVTLLRPRLRRSRGAAMVEAGLVIPVLVCFLGLGTMMFRGYQTKLESNQSIRSAALDYASHDCEGTPSASGLGAPSTRGGVTKKDTTLAHPAHVSGNPESDALQDQMSKTSPAVRGQSGFADATYADKLIANPFPSKSSGGKGLSLRVRGERSTTLCNEPPMDGNLGSMAETVGSEVTKAAGTAGRAEGGRSDFRTKD